MPIETKMELNVWHECGYQQSNMWGNLIDKIFTIVVQLVEAFVSIFSRREICCFGSIEMNLNVLPWKLKILRFMSETMRITAVILKIRNRPLWNTLDLTGSQKYVNLIVRHHFSFRVLRKKKSQDGIGNVPTWDFLQKRFRNSWKLTNLWIIDMDVSFFTTNRDQAFYWEVFTHVMMTASEWF